jgi:hypothetical protein
MKDISCVYSDGHNITLVDSEGNSMVSPLNLNCIQDAKYEFGSLVFTNEKGYEIRIGVDAMVDDSLSRLFDCWSSSYSPTSEPRDSTTVILSKIAAKVLGEFLQTPDGVRAIEKELNNYFNGTS